MRRIPSWLCVFALCAPVAASAASLALQPDQGSYDVGDLVQIDIVLIPAGTPGPGEIEFSITWGTDTQGFPNYGQAVLQSPFTFAPGFTPLAGNDDCASRVGQSSGTCLVRLATSAPLSATTPVLQVDLLNTWAAPAGYELCFPGSPDCTLGSPAILMVALDPVLFGAPLGGNPGTVFGSLGAGSGLRAIPEPGSAALVALGLALLARRPR